MRKATTVQGVLRQIKTCDTCKNKPVLFLGGVPICEKHWETYGEILMYDPQHGRFYLDNGAED